MTHLIEFYANSLVVWLAIVSFVLEFNIEL